MNIKEIARNILQTLHLDLTKNLEYDRLTNKIMAQVIQKDSNCIDVGCHKGEILRKMIHLAPKGKHFAFEPIPDLYNKLISEFKENAQIFPYALSYTSKTSEFVYVKNAPAYSGLKKRKYKVENPDIEILQIQTERLDSLIKCEDKIDFIKIDVEGGEFDVLKGAEALLKRDQPIIIFECGLGSSEFYDTKPLDLFRYLSKFNYKLYTLSGYIKKKNPLREVDFEKVYNNNSEYYFIIEVK
jgi:FkbM family methyltransferase